MDQVDINKLWQNYIDTITNHYADFTGRVGRAQFWYYVLVYVAIAMVVSIVGGVLFLGGDLRALYGLLLLLPSVGMTARRLQDTGRPGSWAWLLAVPVGVSVILVLFAFIAVATLGIGSVLYLLAPLLSLLSLAALAILIFFCAQPGQAEANAYGPPPAPWPASTTPSAPKT